MFEFLPLPLSVFFHIFLTKTNLLFIIHSNFKFCRKIKFLIKIFRLLTKVNVFRSSGDLHIRGYVCLFKFKLQQNAFKKNYSKIHAAMSNFMANKHTTTEKNQLSI